MEALRCYGYNDNKVLIHQYRPWLIESIRWLGIKDWTTNQESIMEQECKPTTQSILEVQFGNLELINILMSDEDDIEGRPVKEEEE